jgi:hypothetical protein
MRKKYSVLDYMPPAYCRIVPNLMNSTVSRPLDSEKTVAAFLPDDSLRHTLRSLCAPLEGTCVQYNLKHCLVAELLCRHRATMARHSALESSSVMQLGCNSQTKPTPETSSTT